MVETGARLPFCGNSCINLACLIQNLRNHLLVRVNAELAAVASRASITAASCKD